MLRDGLAGVIAAQTDMQLAGAAANGAEAVEICRADPPDVVLMDIEMPVLDGIEATRAIVAAQPAVAVLVLTSFSDRRRITGALDAGAVGYLLKDASADEVVQGIRTAAARRLAARSTGRALAARRQGRARSPRRSLARASARCSACCSTACPTS